MSRQTHLQNPQTLESLTKLIQISTQSKTLKSLHAHALKTANFHKSPRIITQLITAYAQQNHKTLTKFLKCMNPTNPIQFNFLISYFSQNGYPLFALKTLSFMHSCGSTLDSYGLCSCLSASASVGGLEFGKLMHCYAVKSGWVGSVFVGSGLIELYGRVLTVGDASRVFEDIPVKNTVCANSLLAGYGERRMWVEGIELVRGMRELGLECDQFTLSAVLRSCAGLSAVELGRQVHSYVMRKVGYVGDDVFLLSSLIEMYGKCGLVGNALRVFNLEGFEQREKKRDVVLWTSMLGAYGRSGKFEEVIELYYEMLKQGVRPDGVAFVTVISACSRTGLVELGVDIFESMSGDHKIDPAPEHYSCLVDLLCRAGELDKAWKVINEIIDKGHGSGNISMWGSLLNACMDRGNLDMGEMAAQKALEMEPDNVGIYIILSNLYAKFGMWDEIQHLRILIRERRLQKDVGSSWIEITS